MGTTISRRRVLVAMGAGVLAGAVPATGGGLVAAATRAFRALASGEPLDLGAVTAATFRPHVGTRFRLSPAAGRALDLTLTDVDERPSADGLTETFVLRFRAGGAPDVDQGTHGLEHDALGRFGMFLVPSGPDGLEAVVNHLLA